MVRKKHDILIAADFLILTLLCVVVGIWAVKLYLQSPPYVPEDKYPIRGIDVSSHNGMMNLDEAANSGIDFIFIKASEGESLRDPNFRLNHAKAGKAGLMRGAYHFFRFDCDGILQAKNILGAVADYDLELGIVIDVEKHGNPTNIPPRIIEERLRDMVDFLNLKGHRVIFYTNKEGYFQYLSDSYAGYPLWICSFSETPINAEWLFWQYDHHGRVPGINGDVDLNAFVGSEEEWHNYLTTGLLQ